MSRKRRRIASKSARLMGSQLRANSAGERRDAIRVNWSRKYCCTDSPAAAACSRSRLPTSSSRPFTFKSMATIIPIWYHICRPSITSGCRHPCGNGPWDRVLGFVAGDAQVDAGQPQPPEKDRVSILARPEGRALHPRHLRQRRRSRRFNPRPARRPSAASHPPTATGTPAVKFQSSPGPKAERCDMFVRTAVRFNPRPARRPSAARHSLALVGATCGFQSSPGPKAERCHTSRRLGRRRCRRFNPRPAQRPSAASDGPAILAGVQQFQSSPGPKAERCCTSGASRRNASSFNPRPARRPSAARSRPCARSLRRVSILARPEGRALLKARASDIDELRFQSSPGPKIRALRVGHPAHRPAFKTFQSSPGPKAERCPRQRSAGEAGGVSILARPEGRALRRGFARAAVAVEVSILARPEGRALPCRDF